MKQKQLMSLLLLVFLVLAACSNTAQQLPPATEEQQANQQVDQAIDEPVDMPVPVPEEDVAQLDVQATKTTSTEEETQEVINQLIADGTYEGEREYRYHAGTELVSISFTVEGDIVQSFSVTPSEDAHSVSKNYINGVNNAMQELLVGKSIAQVDELPDQIARSSLTAKVVKEFLLTTRDEQ